MCHIAAVPEGLGRGTRHARRRSLQAGFRLPASPRANRLELKNRLLVFGPVHRPLGANQRFDRKHPAPTRV
ncbi:MAG: hypothetical protein BWY57_03485 [Betaproteobacteria bacterium ADurb.Bin341]|nr:MAG: hypothetical protein BWY57_03485 [Betaproteobacteria bacterium ADurb.Bin341]